MKHEVPAQCEWACTGITPGVLLLEMGKLRHGRSGWHAHAWPASETTSAESQPSDALGNALPHLLFSLFNIVSLFLQESKNFSEHKMGFPHQKCLLFTWRPIDWSHQAVCWSAAGHGEAGHQGSAHGEEHGQSLPHQRGDLVYWVIPGPRLPKPVFILFPAFSWTSCTVNLTSLFPFRIFFLCWQFNSSPRRAGVVLMAVLTYSLPAAAAPAQRWPSHRCTAMLLEMVLGPASSAVP